MPKGNRQGRRERRFCRRDGSGDQGEKREAAAEGGTICLKAKVRTVNGGRRERMKGLEKLFDLGCLWRRNE